MHPREWWLMKRENEFLIYKGPPAMRMKTFPQSNMGNLKTEYEIHVCIQKNKMRSMYLLQSMMFDNLVFVMKIWIFLII